MECLSAYLWKLEQPAHTVANEYFIATINRMGDELIYTEIDLNEIREVREIPGNFTEIEGKKHIQD